MTNYPVLAALAALLAGATPAASPAAPPAPAGTAAAAAAGTPYRQAPGASLTFTFDQAGAENRGSFGQFTTVLVYDEKNPTAGSLEVTVQMASLDTQDKDRNETLAGEDLLDTKKFPTARYTAGSFAKRADGTLEAVGKLTLRGVTRDLRVPLTIRKTGTGLEISGEVTVRRLDYGVGQGEWKSTEWVGNDVRLQYKVPMMPAKS
ncbi:MAG TPA: YceI family protein [Steroidobacteraceae bacterium]|nr:YceI family protein [Steroidobacteraceae bacterium]